VSATRRAQHWYITAPLFMVQGP